MSRRMVSSDTPNLALMSDTVTRFSFLSWFHIIDLRSIASIGTSVEYSGALPQTPPRGLFEKSPLGSRKNFQKGVGVKGEARQATGRARRKRLLSMIIALNLTFVNRFL